MKRDLNFEYHENGNDSKELRVTFQCNDARIIEELMAMTRAKVAERGAFWVET